jgi:hypothetical protein
MPLGLDAGRPSSGLLEIEDRDRLADGTVERHGLPKPA